MHDFAERDGAVCLDGSPGAAERAGLVVGCRLLALGGGALTTSQSVQAAIQVAVRARASVCVCVCVRACAFVCMCVCVCVPV